MIDNATLVAAMARVIRRRSTLGWSLEDHVLGEALLIAGFTAAEIKDHFDAAKAAALGETASE